MNPILMAALISGGINALKGKRGSDLLKSTIRDTAIAYALGPASPGAGEAGTAGIANMASQQMAKQATGQVSQTAAQQAAQELAREQIGQQAGQMTAKQIGEQAGKTLAERTVKEPSFLEKTFSAIEKPFMQDGKISKFRVGLGAAALGGGAYAAGLFDPKAPPEPK